MILVKWYVSGWFPVNVGLKQGCVITPWLFNVQMDGGVRGECQGAWVGLE